MGTPLNPATYDYAGAVLFNAHASALWSRFTIYLRRELAARLGLTQKAARAVLRISFAKVAEYQKRGLVHFHAVIRLDGPDGNTPPPPPSATVTVLTDAIRAAALRVRVAVASDAIGERELTWGTQLDVREIAAFGTDAELTDQAVAAYVAKYATKSADASGTLGHALFCRPCQGRGATLLPHGTPLPYTACDGTGQARPLPRRPPRPADDSAPAGTWAVCRNSPASSSGSGRTCSASGATSPPSPAATPPTWARCATLAAPGGPNRPAPMPACPTSTRRPRSWSAAGTTSARATAPAPRSSRPAYGTARNWNGSSRPKGAVDDLPPLAVLPAEPAPAPALDLLTVPQVMARLQLGRSAVYDLLRSGQLASITLGRARRIPAHALTGFIRTRLEQEAA